MRRLFQRLGWKLTASYTFVTVATLVVIEVLVLGAALVLLYAATQRLPELLSEEMASKTAPQLSPMLATEEPDLLGINQWFVDSERTGMRSTFGGPGITITINALDIAESNTQFLVLDRQARLLGSIDQSQAPAAPQPFDDTTVPGLPDILDRAYAGESDSDELYSISSSGHLTVAVPVEDERGTVLGVLVYSAQFSPFSWIVGGAAVFVLASSILFTLLVGLLGTIFGFWTARGLTRRLRRVTSATAAWGQGDFTTTIEDRSRDEIGQLGRQLNRMAAELEELIETRQQLSAVDERNRLARDLHDSVKQQVFAISMNLGAAQALLDGQPDAARRRLDTAFELARQSQQELSTIIQTLRPIQLEGSGLVEALGAYTERWRSQSGIAVDFEARGSAAPLPHEVEETLFRVAQEALANVARHSGASHVQVGLTIAGEQAILEIRDNGHGFAAGDTSQGMGLSSMRERITASRGELRVDSSATGTTVTALVPIKRAGNP